jgi:hypothetical protein
MVLEFINLEICEVLNKKVHIWGRDKYCCLIVSRLLWDLSRSSAFTKVTSLFDLDQIFCTIFSDEPTSEECENISFIFFQYISVEHYAPSQIIRLDSFFIILNTIYSDSMYKQMVQSAPSPFKKSSTKENSFRGSILVKGKSTSAFDSVSVVSIVIFNIKAITLTLLAHCIHYIISYDVDKLTPLLINGIIIEDLISDILTRNNLLVIIHAISGNGNLCSHLLDSRIFELLSCFLELSHGTKSHDSSQEYCSNFLRNLSIHSDIIKQLVSKGDIAISNLVKNIFNFQKDNEKVNMDLSIFFSNCSNYLVDDKSALSPKFILDMIYKISPNIESEKDVSDICTVNKYTISTILQRYTFASGVDPSFIQTMLTYMKKNEIGNDPDCISDQSFKYLNEFASMKVVIIINKFCVYHYFLLIYCRM